MRARGFTLIEAVTALAILTAGGALLWLSLRQYFSAEHRFRLRQVAFETLSSEAEILRGRPGPWGDTLYEVPLSTDTLRIRRTVLDSARCDSLMHPFSLEMDDQLRQAWRKRPPEVVLEELKTNGRIFLVLPDYRWY